MSQDKIITHNQRQINITKIEALRLKAEQEDKYLNLDTMRLIQAKSYKTREPKHSDTKLRIFTDNKALFLLIRKELNPKQRPKSVPVAVSKNKNKLSGDKESKVYDLRPRIPKDIKHEIWRTYCAINGQCFCCLKAISENKFEAGHIKPYHHGGADTVDNLRPICFDCNRSMSTLHMYEYMIRHKKKGVDNIPIDRTSIFFTGLVKHCEEAQSKLSTLILQKKITRSQGEKLRNTLYSVRSTIDQRLEILNQVKALDN